MLGRQAIHYEAPVLSKVSSLMADKKNNAILAIEGLKARNFHSTTNLLKKEIIQMKLKIFVFLVATFGLIFGVHAHASCTSNTIGDTKLHNCSDGTSGTSQTIGGTTFHNFNNGATGTSQSVGATTFITLIMAYQEALKA
ncbi:hypothetical protein [Halomonas sp. PR-M31]|uniref:hypothetical protein n=1 Tax=Halomonas sp. PR-M31 TaxID=1471202 RepID=UPI0012E0DBB1|nr:hypothetical protein [Halomonas sp. PR-M31]